MRKLCIVFLFANSIAFGQYSSDPVNNFLLEVKDYFFMKSVLLPNDGIAQKEYVLLQMLHRTYQDSITPRKVTIPSSYMSYDTTSSNRGVKLLITRCDECVAESLIGYYEPAYTDDKGNSRPLTYYDKYWKPLESSITVWDVKQYTHEN